MCFWVYTNAAICLPSLHIEIDGQPSVPIYSTMVQTTEVEFQCLSQYLGQVSAMSAKVK